MKNNVKKFLINFVVPNFIETTNEDNLNELLDNWFNDEYESGYLNLDYDEKDDNITVVDKENENDFEKALKLFKKIREYKKDKKKHY